ncbi:MAG: alkylmercury lyase MerB [Methylococcaceae bacterium]|nr:alkylmercury lyase MerB [Methylococcaceae bacterium]
MRPNAIENPNLEDLVERLRPAFPSLNASEQKVSIQIYRLLGKGSPVTRQMLAESLEMPIETIHKLLNRWWGIHFDDRNRIVGYWGLTLEPTRHRFEVDDKRLYAWCAWDTLFLPEILQTRARVESECATTRTKIRLTLSPERVEQFQPGNAAISFMTPEAARVQENVVTHFCHFVHFFESEDAGLAWTGRHSGSFLLTIDQAHRLGRKINAMRYPDIRKNFE